HVLIGGLFGKEAFKNCIVTGIVLAEDGKKMSKKLKNYPDPMDVIAQYGADAMRFYLLSSSVTQAENLALSEKGVAEITTKNIGRISNVLEFYKLYDDGTLASDKSKYVLDAWILARLAELEAASAQGYEQYQMDAATRPITDFIDDFSAWYVRRSRERFKEKGDDKRSALATLRFVLLQFSKIAAPAMPFLAEYLFQAVRQKDDEESVHLCLWPRMNKKTIDRTLLKKMSQARAMVTTALAARTALGIRVRQPLAMLRVKSSELTMADAELLALIKDEVNVKEIVFDDTIKKDIELDEAITPELREEGTVRDVVRLVQDFRKERGLKPDDRIEVWLKSSPATNQTLEKHHAWLAKEIRAPQLHVGVSAPDTFSSYRKEATLNGELIIIAIS
ncbi:MAG: class I tRNA ligase family protein, partial [Candidatus Saccharimonadales bacterium]